MVEFDHFAHVQSQGVSGHVRLGFGACPVFISSLTDWNYRKIFVVLCRKLLYHG